MKNKFTFLLTAVIILITLIAPLQMKAQEANSFPRDSIIAAAREIIGHLHYCALITTDSTGKANIRTMNPFPPEEDMSVWMATKSDTRKIDEIKKNPKVTLYYANHAAAEGYVAITGKAVLIDDMAEKMKRKRDYWDQSFPDFKYLLLIKIVPERLEVINYKHKMFNTKPAWLAPYIEFKQQ